ncbi:MAG: hypothetical protein ACFFCW_05005 [Candidatus Hodarchaeota archaeon]
MHFSEFFVTIMEIMFGFSSWARATLIRGAERSWKPGLEVRPGEYNLSSGEGFDRHCNSAKKDGHKSTEGFPYSTRCFFCTDFVGTETEINKGQ